MTDEGSESGGGGVQGGGQNHHIGWKARQRPKESASSSSQDAARSPLAKLAKGDSNRGQKGLRPYELPYPSNAGGSAAACLSRRMAGAKEDKGITLRCMYTSQKTKKRKTWSDGAVKCCPTRLRVSLYRWSEALGVTEKLLGEIYLTTPQYQAFIDQGEPELEMEAFLVSLDGVIQPDADDASTGAAGPAAGAPKPGATAIGGGGGGGGGSRGSSTGGVGKKRKLFKAFKPPARRATPPAPPSGDDAWGLPPRQQRQQQQQQRGRMDGGGRFPSPGAGGGDEGDRLPPRTSYTGFGHVESLWDDGDGGGGGDVEGWALGDGAGTVGLAGEGDAGWGMVAGADRQRAHDGDDNGGGNGGMNADSRSERAPPQHQHHQQQQYHHYQQQQQQQHHVYSSSTSLTRDNSRQAWENEEECDGQHMEPPGSGGSVMPSRPRPSFTGDFAVRSNRPHGGDTSQHGGQGDPPSYLEDPWAGGAVGEECPSSTARSPVSRGVGGRDGAVNHHPERRLHDRDGSIVWGGCSGAEGESFGRDAVRECRQGGRAPESSREPAGGGQGSGGGGGGLRSTQEILSLFVGLGANGDDHGSPRGREAAAAATTPVLRPHEPNEGRLDPTVTGVTVARAADMRRAQREARVAAPTGAADGAIHAEAAVDAGAESVKSAAGGSSSASWACEVCGVTGGVSSTSCRVCGAPKRRAPPPGEGVAVTGGGHHRADEPRGEDSDAHRGWSEGDFGGGKGWQEQEWHRIEAATGDKGEGSLDVRGVRGISREGPRDFSACRPFSTPGSECGGANDVARAAAGSSRPTAQRHMSGGRMMMDVGSSSDSDDA